MRLVARTMNQGEQKTFVSRLGLKTFKGKTQSEAGASFQIYYEHRLHKYQLSRLVIKLVIRRNRDNFLHITLFWFR